MFELVYPITPYALMSCTNCKTACRKRRIKCGEERPVCINCTKSKRNCEGYNQRVVFKHPSGAPHLTGHASSSAGPVPLAPSLTPGWTSSSPYPYSDNPQTWGHLTALRQTYDQSYVNSASSLQAFTTFGQDPNYQGHLRPNVTSTHEESSTTSLGWNAQPGVVHSFNYGTSATLPRLLPTSYDEFSSSRLTPNANPYAQALASQPYQSFQNKHPFTIDHVQSLRADSYASGLPETGQSVFPTATQARNFVPAPPFKQPSFPSDEWQTISPPSASAPNGKTFTFGDTFDPEHDLKAKHVKHEVILPGEQTLSSRS